LDPAHPVAEVAAILEVSRTSEVSNIGFLQIFFTSPTRNRVETIRARALIDAVSAWHPVLLPLGRPAGD
jgi:hypothetical protein